jgi:hypothetical protein
MNRRKLAARRLSAPGEIVLFVDGGGMAVTGLCSGISGQVSEELA